MKHIRLRLDEAYLRLRLDEAYHLGLMNHTL